jgi:kynurenine formamidase
MTCLSLLFLVGCLQADVPDESWIPQPKEIIDLGALVTEDLTFRVWGKKSPTERGYDRPNVFEVMAWSSGPIDGQNSYYTLFNHGGPHVDAPNHFGFDGGIDSYPVDSFAGPLKVFDVSGFPKGYTVPIDVFEGQGIQPGDVVMIYTDYMPPMDDDSYPETVTLTRDAAEYLANIPIRAYATDAYSVNGVEQKAVVDSTDPMVKNAPIHHSFLSRGIPVYEQLFNVKRLIDKDQLFFVGVPVNIRDGDGMIVRPVVFVF